jgi:hypothetical protein
MLCSSVPYVAANSSEILYASIYMYILCAHPVLFQRVHGFVRQINIVWARQNIKLEQHGGTSEMLTNRTRTIMSVAKFVTLILAV